MALDLDKRSKVINLCPWDISFTLPNSHGEVYINAGKTTSIRNDELVTMADNNEIMLCGLGNGSHARLYVDNADYREYVGFDIPEEKVKQNLLTEDKCKEILEYKTDSTFEKHVQENIICNHEKSIIMEYCRKTKFNDYKRIQYLEEYTGEKL